MANILQNQYTSVWSTPSDDIPTEQTEKEESTKTIKDIQFTALDIIDAINLLPKHSAPGPDGIGPNILKNCKESISVPLCIFWRKSLDNGSIPKEMKEAHVKPILKKGPKKLSENYRPVSLTSHVIKIFERVVKVNLVNFMEENNLLKNFQHGFRKKRSCLTELIDYQNEILQAVLDNKNMDVIYLDFAKAFDKVDHKIVLQKAKKMGIGGKIIDWLAEFLTNRSQKTVIEGQESFAAEVISGVPQGTVLGPLLFLIMLNDITEKIKYSSLYSFADDTRILKIIENKLDSEHLQEDLYTTYEFADTNNLQFNDNKFELIKFGFNFDLKNETSYKNPTGQLIEEKSKVKDLGVTISNDLKFTDHINNVVSKCRQIIGFILRTFKTRKIEAMILLYKACIQPHLDYCVQLWYPHNVSDMQKLEGIQRTFTDKIAGLQDLNYWQRLEKLNLYSVHRRYERYIIIYIWKVLEQKIVPPNSEEVIAIYTARNGRTCQRFHLANSSSNKLKNQQFNSISRFGSRLFNILPREIRDLTGITVENFKTKLDKFILNLPDEPNVMGYKMYIAAGSNSIPDQLQYVNYRH